MPEQESKYKPIVEKPDYSQPIYKLPSPTALLKEAWEIYKSRFRVFIGIILVPFIAYAIGMYLISLTESIKYLSVIVMVVSFLLIYIFGFWGPLALLYAIKDREENITIIESFGRARGKIFSFFWINILVGLIVTVGILILIIPGIIFSVWYSLSTFILVGEGIRGTDALSKSKEYVSGYSLEVFWRIIFVCLFIVIVAILCSGILSLLMLPLYNAGLNIIGTFFAYLIQLIIYPLTTTYFFLIYSHLKKIKGI